ncbi:MAG: DUF4292 domain-containing protein [Bacteroidota bacterium]|nr:DUF4292 domain-containing protein [Bacteroidota bacterium]
MQLLFKWVLFVLISGLFLPACKTKKLNVKEAEKAGDTKEKSNSLELLLDHVNNSKNYSNAIYFKADADYKDNNYEITLDLEVQALHNQYIWINAKALGFLNVARVLIKPDSIRILDLQRKIYISASYNFMQSFTKAPIQFEQLQNMAWGNATFDPKAPNATLDSLNRMITILLNLGSTQQISAHNNLFKTQTVSLTEQGKNQKMTVNYGNFLIQGNNSFPQQIVINIQGEKKVDCKFTLNNFATELKRDPQFVVPKSYKVQVF